MIRIDWFFIKSDNDPEWQRTDCLYAYLNAENSEILYIGKAYGDKTSVRDRFNAEDKKKFWTDLRELRGIEDVRVLVGEPELSGDQNLTNKLLLDIETLLIRDEEPWGNIMGKESRISRPGMVVVCKGLWQGKQKRYIDED